jgi:hypothetical protein
LKKSYTAADYTPWMKVNFPNPTVNSKQLKITPPCTYATPIIEYFNDPEVKQKLHINDLALDWDLCNTMINVLYDKNDTGSVWVYEALRNKYRILFYSGDIDGAVSPLGTL